MKKLLIALVIIASFGALAGYRINARMKMDQTVKERAQEVTIPAVTTAPVGRRFMQARVQITGNIRPENEVDVFSKANGRIVRVNAELGQKVRQGDVLALVEQEIAVLQLKQANGALAAAKANLLNAEKNAESAEALAKSNNIPDVQLVGARSGLQAAKAQVLQAEAAVGLAQEAVLNTRITSPITGVITRKNVNLGGMVSPAALSPQAALFQVQSLGTLKLEATIDEKEIHLVSVGQPVTFSVDALPGQSFTGTVSHVAPSLDPVSRRATIEVAIKNDDGRLYANMFARGEIAQKEALEVLALPQTALIKGAASPSVFVAKGKVVELRQVTLGESDGEYVAVRDGLSEGDQVVLTGHSRLADGMEITLAQPRSQVQN
jgi:RND family efflux transporter MFP subunit